MPKIKEEKLPKGWNSSEWAERRNALDKLSPKVRKLLAFEWARAAVKDAWSVLPIFEKERPNDDRPRLAIEAAEKVIAGDAAHAAVNAEDAAANKRWKWMCRLYKHAKGPNFTFNSAWRTTTAVELAQRIVAEREFSTMPILADALQDAGLQDEETIAHLQFDVEEWGEGDWCVCQLLGID